MKKFRLVSFIRRKPYTCVALFFITLFILHSSGAFLYLSQISLNLDYKHPVNKPNLTNYVKFYNRKFENFLTLDQLKEEANKIFESKTLDNNFDARFLIENQSKCLNETDKFAEIRLLILIKSAIHNRYQRDIIRRTWADEKRFSDVKIRCLFSIGSCENITDEKLAELDFKKTNKNCQDLIDEENELNKDLIQTDFIDSYYNNTIKTINGIKWIVKNCPKTQFVLLIDDDFYLSVKNLLKHIRFLNYGNEKQEKIMKQIGHLKSNYEKSLINEIAKPKFDPFTEDLYSGFVFNSSMPFRFRFSKWFTNLDEYPFSKWPPFVAAGFVLLSNRSLKSFFFASLYTKPFRFDDIYLSILARKTGINPLHNQDVHFYKHPYSNNGDEYRNVVASHGFSGNLQEMMDLWLLMKSNGHA